MALKQTQGVSSGYKCTLNTIINNMKNANVTVNGSSINGFMGGDFRQGGWPAFLALTTEPQNNIYGAYLKSSADIQAKIDSRKATINLDITRGNGFMSWQKCDPVQKGEVYYDRNLDSKVSVPAAGSKADNFSFGSDLSLGTDEATALGNSGGGLSLQNFETNQTNQVTTDKNGNLKTANLQASQYQPTNCRTETPGSVISGTLQKSLGIPADQLNMADEINEVVNALVGQLVTQVLQKGLASVSGSRAGDKSSAVSQIFDERTPGTASYNQMQAGISSIKGALQSDIIPYFNNAMKVRDSYREALVITQATKNLFTSTIACYQDKIATAQNSQTRYDNTNPNTFTVNYATGKIASLTQTVVTRIDPTITDLNTKIATASSTMSHIAGIETEVNSAASTQELSITGNRIANLITQRALPEESQVMAAQTETITIQDEMTKLSTDAQRELNYCSTH
jgi:hypothetical protein